MQSWTLTLSRYCIYRISTELSWCAIESLSGKCNDKLWLSWRLNEREMHKLRSSSENQSILSRVVSLFNIWMRREAELIFSHLWIGFSILINSRKNRRDEMEGRVRERERKHLPVLHCIYPYAPFHFCHNVEKIIWIYITFRCIIFSNLYSLWRMPHKMKYARYSFRYGMLHYIIMWAECCMHLKPNSQ